MIKVLRIGHATFETPDLAKAIEHFLARKYLIEGPFGRAAHVHIFDEAYLGVGFASKFDEAGQFIVIYAAHRHAVDLKGRQPD